MDKVQRRVHFEGTVQGVGFRYTACRIAGNYDLGGYVRNLPDGRVECVMEGTQAEIAAFVDDLAQAMGGYIRRQNQQVMPYSGKFDSFSVMF